MYDQPRPLVGKSSPEGNSSELSDNIDGWKSAVSGLCMLTGYFQSVIQISASCYFLF